MPNSKQASKRMRQADRQRVANRSLRTAMKSAVKRAGSADAASAPGLLAAAMKRIDKAAKTNVIHKNAAARQKSRLARRMAAAIKK